MDDPIEHLMSFYLVGNLLGRMLTSYALVLCVLWLVSRFDLKRALRRSVAWYSWVAIVVLTLLGVAARVAGQGGLA